MVIGEKLYTSGSSTGSIPKSPSFHSSLELAEATGRQITSINCNIFDFTEMTASSDSNQQQQQQIRNGFVARTIQTFSRLQGDNNQQLDQPTPPTNNQQPMVASNQQQQQYQATTVSNNLQPMTNSAVSANGGGADVDVENNTSISPTSFAFHSANQKKFSINLSGFASSFGGAAASTNSKTNGVVTDNDFIFSNESSTSQHMYNNSSSGGATTECPSMTITNCRNETNKIIGGLDPSLYQSRSSTSIRLSPNNSGSSAPMPLPLLRGQ